MMPDVCQRGATHAPVHRESQPERPTILLEVPRRSVCFLWLADDSHRRRAVRQLPLKDPGAEAREGGGRWREAAGHLGCPQACETCGEIRLMLAGFSFQRNRRGSSPKTA